MSIEMKKVWFDGKKMVTQNIPESDIYKRHWDIASCKAYAEQLRDKNRANTAEHAAEAIEYLLTLTQPEQEPVAFVGPWHGSVLTLIPRSSYQPFKCEQPLYAHPPKRGWVGLTDEERYLNDGRTDEEIEYAKAIEAKLKEKNA